MRARVRSYTLRLARPLRTAHGTTTERRGLLLFVEAADGTQGVGEAAPLPSHGTEDLGAAAFALGALWPRLEGLAPQDALAALDRAPAGARAPAARAAWSTALLDLAARAEGVPLAALLADAPAADVPANAFVAHAGEARAAAAAGYVALKAKAGDADGAAAFAASLRFAAPRLEVRLDANGGWSREEAGRALGALRDAEVGLLEQPLAAEDVEGLAALRARGVVRIGADESAATPERAHRTLRAGAADVLVLKPATLGGPDVAVAVARRAAEAGVGVVVTSALDSAVGRLAALHAAAAVPGVLPCGLDTGRLLIEDVAEAPRPERGRIALPRRAGLGIEIEAGAEASPLA